MKYNKGKHNQKKKRKIIPFCIFMIVLVFSSYILYNYIISNWNKGIYEDINSNVISTEENRNIQKVKYLKQINQEVVGWIEIEDTEVDYPLLQTGDNSYYLTHNYKKEKSKYGSIFINNQSNLQDNHSNIIIYGHNMKDEQMFNSLLQYENEEYYKKHQTIKIATEKEQYTYDIMSVLKSRIFYQDEKDVFRYYKFTDFNNEESYQSFIENCKKIQLYDTKVAANYGEQLLTLITCDYSQDNGRLVVVAKKIN